MFDHLYVIVHYTEVVQTIAPQPKNIKKNRNLCLQRSLYYPLKPQ